MGSNGAALARELREKEEGHAPPEGSPVADLQPGIGRRASQAGINEGQQEGITDGVGMGHDRSYPGGGGVASSSSSS